MTQFLPPNLLALFAARDPIPFKPPAALLPWDKDRSRNPYTGISSQTTLFEDPKDTPPPTRGETKQEKKLRRIKEKAILRAKEIEEEVKNYDPHNDGDIAGDAFKTLFVARINYDTSESKLRREFDMYGPIHKITMVKDSNGKPRGYAFIEFEHERDMHTAYKSADGKKIDGRRVLVDVERGRTVKGWRPRRLGGGLGTTRRGANEENTRQSGRDITRPEREDDRRDVAKSASRDRSRRPPSKERDSRRGDVRRDRDRDRDRKRDRDRDRDRDRKDRGRDRDEPSKDKGRDRDRKHRNRDKSRERDRDGSRRKRSKERGDRKDRDRSDRDKDRRKRSDKDKSKDDTKRETSEHPSEGVKQEGTNGNMDQEQPYDRDDKDGERGNVKQEPDYQNHPGDQESHEKGQGDFQNPEAMKVHPDNEQQHGESENIEY